MIQTKICLVCVLPIWSSFQTRFLSDQGSWLGKSLWHKIKSSVDKMMKPNNWFATNFKIPCHREKCECTLVLVTAGVSCELLSARGWRLHCDWWQAAAAAMLARSWIKHCLNCSCYGTVDLRLHCANAFSLNPLLIAQTLPKQATHSPNPIKTTQVRSAEVAQLTKTLTQTADHNFGWSNTKWPPYYGP